MTHSRQFSEGNSEAAPIESAASESVARNASDSNDLQNWGGWTRTTNIRINSAALCRLSYTPKAS